MTSTNSKQGSRWGGFFQNAVAGLESRLDTILAEDGSSPKARPQDGNAGVGAHQAQKDQAVSQRKSQDLSRSSSKARPNDKVQERLAKAMIKNNAAQSRSVDVQPSSELPSRTASPLLEAPSRQSPDTVAASSEATIGQVATTEDHLPVKLNHIGIPMSPVASTPQPAPVPSPILDSLPRLSIDSVGSEVLLGIQEKPESPVAEVNGIVHDARTQEDYKMEGAKLQKDFEESEARRVEEMHANLERIDALQAKLQYFTHEALQSAKRTAQEASAGSAERKLAEKDVRIALLMEEGEKLSKTELKHLQTIRKMRGKSVEDEKTMVDLKRKLAAAEQQKTDLTIRVRRAEAAERRAIEREKQTVRLESEVSVLRQERDDFKVALADTRRLLDKAVLEAKAAEEKARTVGLEAEQKTIAGLQQELSTARVDNRQALDQARSELSYVIEKAAQEQERTRLTEMELRVEITNLENRVEAMRARAEDVSSSARGDNQATLLRQIETLQTQYSMASENWQGIEASLMSRARALEQERDEISKREADARRKAREVITKSRKLEDELETVRRNVENLEQDLDNQRSSAARLQQRLAEAQRALTEAQARLDAERASWAEELTSRLEEAKTKWCLETPPMLQSQAPLPFQSPILHFSRTDSIGTHERKHSTNNTSQTPNPLHVRRNRSKNPVDALDLWSSRPPSRRASTQIGPGVLSRTESAASLNNLTHAGSMNGLMISNADVIPETPRTGGRTGGLDFTEPGTPPSLSATQHRRESNVINDMASLYTIGAGPSVQLVERMSAAVRRLESEKASTREELTRLTSQRDEGREEVLRLMKEAEEAKALSKQVQSLEEQLSAVSLRYEEALQIVGEKSETVEELEADVADLKRMYRDLVDSAMK